jgi:hypothetical protein
LSAAYLLLDSGLIPFSPAVVYAVQILSVSGILTFAREIAAENRENMKPPAAVDPDDS